MNCFDDEKVNINALKKKAFNYRWAEVPDGVIPLTAADPDYPVAPEIQSAMQNYISDGYFSYTPKTGFEEFKESFVKYVKDLKNEDIDPRLVLPLDSAARSMFVIAQTFLRPGDEMIVFDPCDFLFRSSCISSGATPVPVPVKLDPTNRKMDLSQIEKYITPHTKMLGLCNPHNPYGLSYTRRELEYIMEICEKHNLLIMNDEIWSDIIYPDGEFNSIYSLGNERCNRVLSVFGYSKSFGLAGLRIGCVYTTDKDKFQAIVDHSDVMSTAGGATSISQVAAIAAMNHARYWVKDFVSHLTENRDYAVDFINHQPYLHAYKPKATYLLYVDISETGMTGAEFCDYLKREVNLALIPGGHEFFGDQSEGHIRICIATSTKILHDGMNRLQMGMEHLAAAKSGAKE